MRTIVRSGAYLTHDDGLYARTSPLRAALRPALQRVGAGGVTSGTRSWPC